MIWQDIVPIVGNCAFTVALLFSIFSKQKPHRWTCAMTAGVLFAYVVTFWDMTLWYWSLATLATASAWTILLFQRRLP
ncbi:MAG: hypothetical protein KAS32_21070 [Candidatus Peribacteraceae bacterium]|nr:hypothetical protein [Candidatus Peribacteraceae bacterium]